MYKASNRARGCCDNRGGFHRRCIRNGVTNLNECQTVCTADYGCKGYVILTELSGGSCHIATASSTCPDNFLGPYNTGNVQKLDPDGTCGTAGVWGAGCVIKIPGKLLIYYENAILIDTPIKNNDFVFYCSYEHMAL